MNDAIEELLSACENVLPLLRKAYPADSPEADEVADLFSAMKYVEDELSTR